MKNTNISNLLREIITEDKDKQTAEHLGTLRGALMHVQTLAKAERPYSEILAYVEKALGQVSSSDPLSETEGDKKLYSKQEAADHIKNNPPAKYYKIGVSSNSVQQAQSIEDAINIIDQSPIKQFELSTYGQVIQFSAPLDAGNAATVRGMGRLD